MLAKIVGGLFGVVLVIVVMAVVAALPVMLLWNHVVVDVTKNAVTPLTIWQALGLLILCGLLFKSSGVSSK
jgi:hypothetical protein